MNRWTVLAYYHTGTKDSLEVRVNDSEKTALLNQFEDVSYGKTVCAPKRGNIIIANHSSAKVAFVLECKKLKDPICLSGVLDVVKTKFDKYPECPLFFIFTLMLGPRLRYVKYPGFFFWRLTGTADPDVFDLVKMAQAGEEPHPNSKCVIIVSLHTLWGADFKKNCERLFSMNPIPLKRKLHINTSSIE
jgi:hypothetical protein